MKHQITEVQDKNTTRVYNIEGVKKETVESFWNWLQSQKVIESYEIA